MAQLLTSLKDFPSHLRGGAVAVGNFDGVHRGHAKLIEQLLKNARQLNGPAVILTFDPPPVAILVPDRPPTLPLTSIQRRAKLLGKLGVTALVAYPTDRALLSLTAEEFFRGMIIEAMGAKAVVEGPNFRFGKDRGGDTKVLAQLCVEANVDLCIVPAQNDTGAMISSTRIRELLSEGAIEAANAMLTQPYVIEGIVAKGSQRGRDLGFPTANLAHLRSLTPGFGVYAGVVHLHGQDRAAAVNIGPNPTFGESLAKVEVHIMDWSGDIYGEDLACTLLAKIRDVRRFESVELLKEQLREDISMCQAVAAQSID